MLLAGQIGLHLAFELFARFTHPADQVVLVVAVGPGGAQEAFGVAPEIVGQRAGMERVEVQRFQHRTAAAQRAFEQFALHMVHACAADPEVGLPLSGVGGVATWRDAAEFLALGAANVQVCTAIMHHGFGLVEHLIEGLSAYLDSKGFASLRELQGRAVPNVTEWSRLDLNAKRVAHIDHATCIHCNLCYVACEDGAYQCIDLVDPVAHGLPPARLPDRLVPLVREDDCVGCNLCSIVCPVDGCIQMVPVETGRPPMSWEHYQAGVAAGSITPISPQP